MAERRYTREEVDAILARALRSTQEEGLTHDELVTAAREVGVSPDAVAKAAEAVDHESRIEREAESLRRRQLRAFFGHLTSYVVVCAFLAALNFMTGGALWFQWVLFGWGIGIAMHLRRVLLPDIQRERERARKREERQRKRDLRRQRQHELSVLFLRAPELEVNARELSIAVTKGLATVASAAAARLEQELRPKPRVRIEPAAPRVGADEPPSDEDEEGDEQGSAARRPAAAQGDGRDARSLGS